MPHKVILRFVTFVVTSGGRIYILAVDYDRYFIGEFCPDVSQKGKYIYCENVLPLWLV